MIAVEAYEEARRDRSKVINIGSDEDLLLDMGMSAMVKAGPFKGEIRGGNKSHTRITALISQVGAGGTWGISFSSELRHCILNACMNYKASWLFYIGVTVC